MKKWLIILMVAMTLALSQIACTEEDGSAISGAWETAKQEIREEGCGGMAMEGICDAKCGGDISCKISCCSN